MTEREWNPRFVVYAAERGNTPEAQLEADKVAWPGGCMCGFMLWIQERWTAWAEETGGNLRYPDHKNFDRFIGATS